MLMVLIVIARLSLNAQCTSQSVEGAERPSREDQLLPSIHIQNSQLSNPAAFWRFYHLESLQGDSD